MSFSRRRFVTGCATCVALLPAITLAENGPPTWQTIAGPGFTLSYVGRMRDVIMTGDRSAKLSLRELRRTGHRYGLGPVAELDGEIIMVDGHITHSAVDADGRVKVAEVEDASVPFFVWADVSKWERTALRPAFASIGALSDAVGEAGLKAGLGTVFPFMVTGRFRSLAYHIVKGRPGAPPGMDEHRKMQHSFDVADADATLLGFWSDHHQGIFTPADSKMHVHFVTGDQRAAGHLQGLTATAESLTLLLPH